MERPNLKICIENDEDSDSDEEKPIVEVFVDDEESEESEDGEISSSKHSESGRSDLESNHNEDVENKDEAPLEVSMDQKHWNEPKRYENKGGEFPTGFDLMLKEYVEMREKRAERFNIKDPPKTLSEDELKALYDSLGIKQQDIDSGERGIRLEAIHIRGVDHMSTKDVFQYFQDFAPGTLEWIDDISCNVIWLEAVTAARAMFHMSTVKDENMKQLQERRTSRSSTEQNEDKSTTESMEVEDAAKPDSKDGDNKESPENTDSVEQPEAAIHSKPEDDFDYELNLMSDDEDNENKDGENKTSEKPGPEEHMEDSTDLKDTNDVKDKEDEETESQKQKGTDSDNAEDMDVDSTMKKMQKKDTKEFPMPPGKWRIGVPFANKAQILYFRYATRADKKMPGAEKRSHYYRQYGNPNFGGMKGLISGSKKRRILSSKYRKEEEEAKKMIAKTKKFSSLSEETTFDDHLKTEQERLKKSRLELREVTPSDEEEYTDEEEDEKKFDEFADVEDELRTLLGESSPPPKKRTMRMYADDVEEEIKKKRSGPTEFEESPRHSHRSSTHDRLGDARSRIKGRRPEHHSQSTGDLRNRLGHKQRDEREAFGISYVPSLTIQVEPD